eukprot:SAG11_NODE_341_length_10462_cov_49.272990_11_plen_219_part_00
MENRSYTPRRCVLSRSLHHMSPSVRQQSRDDFFGASSHLHLLARDSSMMPCPSCCRVQPSHPISMWYSTQHLALAAVDGSSAGAPNVLTTELDRSISGAQFRTNDTVYGALVQPRHRLELRHGPPNRNIAQQNLVVRSAAGPQPRRLLRAATTLKLRGRFDHRLRHAAARRLQQLGRTARDRCRGRALGLGVQRRRSDHGAHCLVSTPPGASVRVDVR